MSISMLGSKKGQGMSLNTIIIAIIVLIVLVIIVMIFSGYFARIFAPSVKSCQTGLGGTCVTAATDCNADGDRILARYAQDKVGSGSKEATDAGCLDSQRICCGKAII